MPSQIDQSLYQIWLTSCVTQSPNQPVHWIILLVHPGSDHCTWYHSVVDTRGRIQYRMMIEPNKRFDSPSFCCKYYLGTIPVELGIEVSRQANRIPPQNCQYWALYLILRLERRRILPRGSFDAWSGSITELWGDQGAGDLRH